MLGVEGIREISQRITTSVRDLARGYSDSDLDRERRILEGDITGQDRELYRFDPEKYAGLLAESQRFMPCIDPTSAVIVMSYLKRCQELGELPDDKIDSLLRNQARTRLENWHKLPRVH